MGMRTGPLVVTVPIVRPDAFDHACIKCIKFFRTGYGVVRSSGLARGLSPHPSGPGQGAYHPPYYFQSGGIPLPFRLFSWGSPEPFFVRQYHVSRNSSVVNNYSGPALRGEGQGGIPPPFQIPNRGSTSPCYFSKEGVYPLPLWLRKRGLPPMFFGMEHWPTRQRCT